MSQRDLPAAPNVRPVPGLKFRVLPRALERWNPGIQAAEREGERTISILDVIGFDLFGDGITAKRVAGALRHLGAGPVTVNVNSPGGDFFEGLAIYNLLRDHDGEIDVKVLGLAASAASLVAMAGDQIRIARAGFFMVHNVWAVAVGNRHDFREFADWLEPFDEVGRDVYSARTGIEAEEMAQLLDAETWINGSAAVDQGFADDLLPADQVEQGQAEAAAAKNTFRLLEALLRESGYSRAAAQRVLSDFKSSVRDSVRSGVRDSTERKMQDHLLSLPDLHTQLFTE